MRPPQSLKPESKKSNQERWLVSYADFVTLLLAFFVAIYSVTRLDKEKLAEAQESIQEATHSFFPQLRPRVILGGTGKVARDGQFQHFSPSPPPGCTDRGHREQLFGDMGNSFIIAYRLLGGGRLCRGKMLRSCLFGKSL
jgi:hypothetical protein